ncbi:uncharacterized protein LOC116415418 [Apis florea]|uniref:uncharacterized protein LOC116415418 n=1 Tax=Apis florea TaxID=7463 RepID=UPI0012FEE04A|nr:uncharacterized protein LOC116415418 [Apis florea]
MLEGKVAVVTGAAQGIGFAISEEFAKQKSDVVLTDYNPEVTKVAAKLNEQYAGKIKGLVLNVMDTASIKQGLQEIITDYGKIDYVMNNAGGGVLKPFAELTDEDFDKTVNLDFALGSVYNPGGMGAYNAAKNGIIGMTQAAAIDYADKNIRVNSVAPGLTKTPLNEGGFLDKILPTVPMKRAETAAEVAKVFVFVASQATFMTGQTILSDGGVSVGLK